MSHHWGYAGSELPPDQWYKDWPIANTGKRQSPIDICCSQEHSYPPLDLCYHKNDLKSVSNNGHTVTFSTSGGKSVLSGGPLTGTYNLEQFHFHWGGASDRGSEHQLKGHAFAAEVHFVHWNAKYGSFNASLGHPDGLCVLGGFIESGEENCEYNHVVEVLKNVCFKGNTHTITKHFDFKNILPEALTKYADKEDNIYLKVRSFCRTLLNKQKYPFHKHDRDHFFFYPGSLTTPPLKECVEWIVFKHPVCLSEAQLNAYRSLHSGETAASPKLVDNFRPVQPLHDRKILGCCL